MEAFHNKYRNADVLLVDDVQFIAGRESTQEEFFHTFNELSRRENQIVLTSDRPPKEITTLDERLRTRFEWGLIADVQPPDIETRMAIVKRKAQMLGLDITDEVVQYIASKLKNNIRQLEGAVKKMQAFINLHGAQMNTATAQNAIRDILSESEPVDVICERIIEEVARTFGVDPAGIRSRKRDASTAQVRRVAIYVISEMTGLSTEAIGGEFGRDHSTVIYSLSVIKKEMARNSSLRATINDIIKNVEKLKS
jgi:chromosomal replication initiator protein